MAKKYLDLEGLKILWAKIVNKIQTDIKNKANISGTLQKDDIIIALDQGTIVNSGVQLSKLATKDELSAIPKFAIQVVTSLPTSNISTTTVYLLSSGSDTNNIYTEYIYVNSKWEKLGEQKVDLTSYVQYTGSIHDDAIIIGSSEGTVKEHASLTGTSISNHLSNTSNPHGVTKAQVDLGNVENKACDTSVTSGSTNYVTSGAVYSHVHNSLLNHVQAEGDLTEDKIVIGYDGGLNVTASNLSISDVATIGLVNTKEGALSTKIDEAKTAANNAYVLAMGRSRSHVFDTKSAMETALQTAPKGQYKVGDNIFITDISVPDYWVSKVTESDSATYAVIEVSPLETQKVDLSPYLKNTGTQVISGDDAALYLKVSSEGDRTEGVIFTATGSIITRNPDGSSDVYYLPGMGGSGGANYELALKYDLPTAISDADINALS